MEVSSCCGNGPKWPVKANKEKEEKKNFTQMIFHKE
jgi:hypothetical protein